MKHPKCPTCGEHHPHYTKEWLGRWLSVVAVFRHLGSAAILTAPLWFAWELFVTERQGYGGWAWLGLHWVCRYVVGRMYDHIERRQLEAIEWLETDLARTAGELGRELARFDTEH